MDIDGAVAVVGAVRDDEGLLIERGAAYVFRFDGAGWIEEAALISGRLRGSGRRVRISEHGL